MQRGTGIRHLITALSATVLVGALTVAACGWTGSPLWGQTRQDGVGLRVPANAQMCRQDGYGTYCQPIDLSQRPWGPTGTNGAIDYAAFDKRYPPRCFDDPAKGERRCGWERGFCCELFGMNFAALSRAYAAWRDSGGADNPFGFVGSPSQWSGVPTPEEIHDLAMSRNRGDATVCRFAYPAGGEGRDPKQPSPTTVYPSSYPHYFSEVVQPCSRTYYWRNDAYDGTAPMYGPSYPHVFGEPGAQPTPTVAPAPTPQPTAAPIPTPAPVVTPTPQPAATPIGTQPAPGACKPATPVPSPPPGCVAVETLAGKPAPSTLTWNADRAAKIVECAAWIVRVKVLSLYTPGERTSGNLCWTLEPAPTPATRP